MPENGKILRHTSFVVKVIHVLQCRSLKEIRTVHLKEPEL